MAEFLFFFVAWGSVGWVLRSGMHARVWIIRQFTKEKDMHGRKAKLFFSFSPIFSVSCLVLRIMSSESEQDE